MKNNTIPVFIELSPEHQGGRALIDTAWIVSIVEQVGQPGSWVEISGDAEFRHVKETPAEILALIEEASK